MSAEIISRICSDEMKERFADVYGAFSETRRGQWLEVAEGFEKAYGCADDAELFSAPGRTEICGNHTDHQHGFVVAGAVNCDTIACAKKNTDSVIRVRSKEYGETQVSIKDLSPRADEKNTSAALVRGAAAGFAERGYVIDGVDIYTSSDVLSGSGVSSSASFEVLIGTIFNEFFCGGKVLPADIAKIGQYAENCYFGKPCGLLDQMACALGGVTAIDFADEQQPQVEKIGFDPQSLGYTICIIDTGASHAELTDEYAAIPAEMKTVAQRFGKNYLAEVDEGEFYSSLNKLIGTLSDRALLRAIHFFDETKRAKALAVAVKSGNIDDFLSIVNESGRSSFMYLQNVFSTKDAAHCNVALCLAICEKLLNGRGAFRVHGGGFAGTIQAFVPNDYVSEFKTRLESIVGNGRCRIMNIRGYGGIKL